MVEHEITSVADGRARTLSVMSAIAIALGIAAMLGVFGTEKTAGGWWLFGFGLLGGGIFGLSRQVMQPRAFKMLGAGLALAALLLVIDSAPLLFEEKVPRSVKPPVRMFFDRTPFVAGILPVELRAMLIGAGLTGLWVNIDRMSLAVSRLLMIVVAVVVSIMFYEVFVRYVLNQPTLWVNEMSLWFAGGIYLMASLYVLQQRAHIRIFILYDIVPRSMQRIFDLVSTMLIFAFSFAIIYGGFKESWRKFLRWETFGTAWDPPIPATIKPLILLTLILIALQALSNLICDWGRDKETHDLAEEVAEDVQDLVAEQRAA